MSQNNNCENAYMIEWKTFFIRSMAVRIIYVLGDSKDDSYSKDENDKNLAPE